MRWGEDTYSTDIPLLISLLIRLEISAQLFQSSQGLLYVDMKPKERLIKMKKILRLLVFPLLIATFFLFSNRPVSANEPVYSPSFNYIQDEVVLAKRPRRKWVYGQSRSGNPRAPRYIFYQDHEGYRGYLPIVKEFPDQFGTLGVYEGWAYSPDVPSIPIPARAKPTLLDKIFEMLP